MARRYPERPLVGVGGIVFEADRVLLVRRGQPPAQGMWSIPGGLVEVGETLTQAVAREMLEETGVTVEVGPLVEIYERIDRDSSGRVAYHYVILDYLCRRLDGLVAPASDAAEAGFFALNELSGLNLTPAAGRVVTKARAMVEQAWPVPKQPGN